MNAGILITLAQIAPGLLGLLVDLVVNVEQAVTGVGQGEVKKNRVLDAVRNVLDSMKYFTDAGADRQNEILSLVGQAIDLIVSGFNVTGLFKTSKKIDFTPVPPRTAPPAGGQDGRARLGALLTLCAMLVLSFLAAAGCSGKKELTPATEVVYEGPMLPAPDAWSYASAGDLAGSCLAVKACMGIPADLPLPNVRGMKGGNAVDCGGTLKESCYTPGLIVVPEGASVDLVSHECVHHWLWITTGDLDAEHKSDWFVKCGGKLKLLTNTGEAGPEATPAPE